MASTLMLGLGIKATRATINATRSYNKVYGRAGALYCGYNGLNDEVKIVNSTFNGHFTPAALANIGRAMVVGWFVPLAVVGEYGCELGRDLKSKIRFPRFTADDGALPPPQ